MSGIVSSVISGMSRVVSSVTSGVSRAVNAVRNFVGQFASAGMDLMRGLVNGIKQGMSWVVNAAKNVAQNAVNAAKSALGIHSPSKVFKGIGGYTMEGFAIGINSEGKSVISGMGAMAQRVSDAFDPSLNVPSIQRDLKSASASANANITHTHEYKTNPSQRVVTVKMDVNNDALTHIVNGQNADRDATFTF